MNNIKITKEMASRFIYDETSRSCLKLRNTNKEVGGIDSDSRGGRYRRWRVSLPGVGLLLAHRVVWVVNNGEIPENLEIDHIDGNALNNRITNLRLADRGIATKNLSMRCDNKTGFTGVSYRRNNQTNLEMYVAKWKESNKDRTKAFSISKYGREVAFKLACDFRKMVIERLKAEGYGYADTHGDSR